MKYIFVAGAPGSKWSSVCKNIYYSDSIDQTDASENREYWHDASGQLDLMHIGAYFDPGMEFGDFFDNINKYTKEECESPKSVSLLEFVCFHILFARYLVALSSIMFVSRYCTRICNRRQTE